MQTTKAMRDRIRELATGEDDYDRAVLLLLDDFEGKIANTDGPMVRARKIVEDYIQWNGMIPAPDLLKEAIAAEIGFVQLASIPHREEIERIKKERDEWQAKWLECSTSALILAPEAQ
jgi:hypothetical protein